MKAVAILLSIIIFTACLVLGIQAGNTSFASQPPDPTATNQVTRPAPILQRTLLLISVDDLKAETPRLTGVWLAFYRLDMPRITILPVYPANPGSEMPDVARNFALSPDDEPVEAFYESIRSSDLTWDGYLLIDLEGTAGLIDWLQGVSIEGIHLDGTSAVASLSPLWDDEQASLLAQKRLGKALCDQIASLPSEMDWLGLTSRLIPEHLHTDLGLEFVVADWKSLVSGSTPLTCEFPIP